MEVRIVTRLIRKTTRRQEDEELGMRGGAYNVLFLDPEFGFLSVKVALFLRYV